MSHNQPSAWPKLEASAARSSHAAIIGRSIHVFASTCPAGAPRRLKIRFTAAVLILATCGSAVGRAAPLLTTLVNFNGDNGSHPNAGLVFDQNHNLFGTTPDGGAGGNRDGLGSVFEVTKINAGNCPTAAANGDCTTLNTLASFYGTSSDGRSPQSGLIFDAAGNLYGTTYSAKGGGDGTVYEIVKTANGYITL
jgi:hypothetical protein